MSIETLIDDYSLYIYNFALKLTCHPVQAEDLAQETFIHAWKSLNTLKTPEAVGGWLRQICYHLFLMELRKKQAATLNASEVSELEQDSHYYVSSAASPEEEVLVSESIKELQNGCFLAMVRRLTLHQRLAFSLVDMFGLSPTEAADIIGVSEKAVKGLLYRGRMNLDAFFHSHCNLLNIKNACSCQAWLAFSQQKADLKQSVHGITLVDRLDYTQQHYTYNPDTRAKIHYLYAHMPDKKPSQAWYDQVAQLLRSGQLSSSL